MPGDLKFWFFRSTENLAAAKKELLLNCRCRRVGFSRLPSTPLGARKLDPHACDIHFLADAGVPIAWMWGLNMRLSQGYTQSSADETSTVELAKDMLSSTDADTAWHAVPYASDSRQQWTNLPTPSNAKWNSPVSPDWLEGPVNDSDFEP